MYTLNARSLFDHRFLFFCPTIGSRGILYRWQVSKPRFLLCQYILQMVKFWPKIVSEYDQETPQPQIADNPTHREEEPSNHQETPGRQTKQSNQPPPTKTTATPEWTQSNAQQNTEQPQIHKMGAKPVFGVSDKVIFKTTCSATETS